MMQDKFVAIAPVVKMNSKMEPANGNDFRKISRDLNSPHLKHNVI